MKKYLNNRGYTMVMVLLSIVLISLFAMMLIPKSVNTALQVNKSEEMTQTKDLAEMGITYTHSLIENRIKNAIQQAKAETNFSNTNHDRLFCEKLVQNINNVNFLKQTPTPETISITNSTYSFKVERNNPLKIASGNNVTCEKFDSLTIPVKSTGMVGGSKKEVTAEFTIKNRNSDGITQAQRDSNGQIIPVPPEEMNLVAVNSSVSFNGSSGSRSIYANAHFKGLVTISGQGELYVAGNAVFDGSPNNPSVNFNGNNSKLIISGDAYFRKDYSLGGNGGNYICVRGSSFIYENNRWVEINRNRIDQACPQTVFQSVSFMYDIEEWGIMDIDIKY